MLDEALNNARAIIASEIDEAQQRWVRRVAEIQADYARRGVLTSGMYIAAVADACTEELVLRGRIIWEAVKGCTTALARHPFDGLHPDIVRAIKSHFDVATDSLASTIEQSGRAADAAYTARRVMQFRNRADAVLAEYEARTSVFLENRGHMPDDPAPRGGMTFNFHGPVGAVQTGPNATAYSTINIEAARPEGVAALDRLDALLEKVPAAQADTVSDVRQASTELRTELSRGRPNMVRVVSSFVAIGTWIRTLGELGPAYELVRHFLSAHAGITLPPM